MTKQQVTTTTRSSTDGPLELIHGVVSVLACGWLFWVCIGDGVLLFPVVCFAALYLLVTGSMALVSALARKSPLGLFCAVFPIVGTAIMVAIGSVVPCRNGWLIALPFHSVLFCLTAFWTIASTVLIARTSGKLPKHRLNLLGCGGAKHPMSPQMIDHIQQLSLPEEHENLGTGD